MKTNENFNLTTSENIGKKKKAVQYKIKKMENIQQYRCYIIILEGVKYNMRYEDHKKKKETNLQ